jgi:AraC-like DNA-binding protein
MGATPADRCKLPTALWRSVEAMGIPPAALLRQARLPATLHLGEQGHVTTAQYFALMRALEDLTGDPALGIRMVEAADTAAHPPSSLAAFYARDYRDGLARLARFKRLCTPEILTLTETGDDAVVAIGWPHAGGPEPSITVDIAFATLVELGRRGSGQRIVPRRIELTRVGPPESVHAAYFGCPIRFGATRDLLVLDRADLDRPFPGHNPELLTMLTPALSAALGELDAHATIADQVRIVLRRSLPSGRPDIGDVARQMGLAERTLQRRITAAGSSFRALLDDARQDMGRALLADPANGIDEVACLLGYQDTSSFYRAFREWEGVTPARWREQHAPRLH